MGGERGIESASVLWGILRSTAPSPSGLLEEAKRGPQRGGHGQRAPERPLIGPGLLWEQLARVPGAPLPPGPARVRWAPCHHLRPGRGSKSTPRPWKPRQNLVRRLDGSRCRRPGPRGSFRKGRGAAKGAQPALGFACFLSLHPLLIKEGSLHDNCVERGCMTNELGFCSVDISSPLCPLSHAV